MQSGEKVIFIAFISFIIYPSPKIKVMSKPPGNRVLTRNLTAVLNAFVLGAKIVQSNLVRFRNQHKKGVDIGYDL